MKKSRRPTTVAVPPAESPTKPAAADLPTDQPIGRPVWQWFVLAAAAGIALCANKLNLNLWYDEIYTLQAFVSKPIDVIVTDYSAPNNHLFYSLILRFWYQLSANDFVLRLPGLLFAVGTLACLFHMAWRWQGLTAAVAATLTLGLNVMYLTHAMQLRGYGLSTLLVVLLADLVLGPRNGSTRATNWPWSIGVVAVATALVYTIPTNLLFAFPLGVFSVLRGWRNEPSSRGAVLLTWATAAVATMLCYLPVMEELLSAAKKVAEPGITVGWQMVVQYVSAAMRDWIWLAPVLLPVAVVAAVQSLRKRRWPSPVVTLLLLTHVVPFALCAVLGQRLFARNFCPLLPFSALAVGMLVGQLCDWLRARWLSQQTEEGLLPYMALVLALPLGIAVFLYPARLDRVRAERFAQDGYFNYYAANYQPAAAAAWLQATVSPTVNYQICVGEMDHFNIDYYLREYKVAGTNQPRAATARTVYCVVPPLPDWQSLSRQSGLPVERLQKFQQVAEFGYYRVLRGSAP